MKTSNKLLIILLALILVVPLLMMLSFKKAIQSDQYVVKNFGGENVIPFRSLKPFRVVKFDGSLPGMLQCTIKHGDQYGYNVQSFLRNDNTGKIDSSIISYTGDTLVISYHFNPSSGEANTSVSYSYNNVLELTVPRAVPVIAKGATVNIDSSSAVFGAMNFVLSDNAVLNISGATQAEAIPLGDNLFRDSVVYQTVYPTLFIDANNSEVNIAQSPVIQNLRVDLKGSSRFSIRDKVVVDTLQGTISPESIANAPYRFVKYLKPVNER